ncbi:MBL fold metallo-hydrolase [Nonomuraea africana]|uniref:Ribonuclease BN (tRNA processing enzyme) n=1 Tax=Nonomuraea africana TaxID=46171 RepID=A0ABR9K5G9_9ACTN|nr:MBL fold metallo-hydrolase [Nonomuraea africana]MBE1557258.1 ribonuclease BN (tRNA processing enzyme) [Nonomuraea africana]
MRITVLGGSGAWPTAGEACSGFLVEHDGFRLLLDLGYAALPRLLETTTAESVDAVVISHGHPDHCADLNPLLRARALGGHRPPPLPIHALPGSLAAVLSLDRPGMLDEAYRLCEFEAGDRLALGPFTVDTALLPHWVPNAAVRVRAGDTSVTYTGDGGPSPDLVALARGTDLLIAEATYPDHLPPDDAGYLTSALQAGQQAAQAGAGRLLLTHLWPGTAPEAAVAAAGRSYRDEIAVAAGGLTVEV